MNLSHRPSLFDGHFIDDLSREESLDQYIKRKGWEAIFREFPDLDISDIVAAQADRFELSRSYTYDVLHRCRKQRRAFIEQRRFVR